MVFWSKIMLFVYVEESPNVCDRGRTTHRRSTVRMQRDWSGNPADAKGNSSHIASQWGVTLVLALVHQQRNALYRLSPSGLQRNLSKINNNKLIWRSEPFAAFLKPSGIVTNPTTHSACCSHHWILICRHVNQKVLTRPVFKSLALPSPW